VLPRTVTLESMDGWIDLNHLIWSRSTTVEADRFRSGLLSATGSFRKDAPAAIVVGLFLSEDLIGLIVRLWACFAKFQCFGP